MSAFFDTIAAPITGVQKAAVAIIRLSGPDSWRIASQIFRPWPEPVKPRYALYGTFSHGDDGLAIPFEEGHSYTGEQCVELSIHGSPASVRALLELCYQHGARPADPGEFTRRAFMNGRIDLTQAESVRDVIESETAIQLQTAQRNRAGKLREAVQSIATNVNSVLTAVEATTDFSEEIGDLDVPVQLERLNRATNGLNRLIGTAAAGAIIRQGALVIIMGRPNAGKSSLLNAIVQADRAIVTPIPGTTRDVLETFVEINGFPVRLFDTAGVRATDDPVESEGVRRARDAAESADLVLYLYAADEGWTQHDDAELASLAREPIIVANKCDLARASKGIELSATTGQGLPELLSAISNRLNQIDTTPVVNARHQAELEAAVAATELAAQTLASDLPADLASVHLRTALDALGRVIGESVSVDVIEQIFRDFCIGK